MTFNITGFRANVNKMGLAKNNLFEMVISPPRVLRNQGVQSEFLRLMCHSTELPALDIVTYDTKPYAFGPTEKRPAGLDFNTLNTTFYVDEAFNTMNFFQSWISKIVDYNSYRGTFQVYYKESYATTLDLYVYSGNDTKYTRHYTLYNAYPVNVGSVTTAWANQNEVMTLPVGFAYDGINIETVTR